MNMDEDEYEVEYVTLVIKLHLTFSLIVPTSAPLRSLPCTKIFATSKLVRRELGNNYVI